MFAKIMRTHVWSSRALAFVVAMLAIWVVAICCGVFEIAIGRPKALACVIVAGLVVRDPLNVVLAGLAASRSLEKRSARIRALAARRALLGGRGSK